MCASSESPRTRSVTCRALFARCTTAWPAELPPPDDEHVVALHHARVRAIGTV